MSEERSLTEIFQRLIATTGPISLTHYMAEANARYYAKADPFGAEGDFITAPEISQMFGELIGLWLSDMWIRAGREEPVHYVELGPGRGTLARDALKAMKRFGLEPQVHFVETSTALKRLQLDAVPGAIFHDDLSTVPMDGPILLVANEFLDALPLRQLIRTAEGWREVMVAVDGERFVCVPGARPMDAALPEGRRNAPEGTLIETSPAAAAVIYEAAGRLEKQGGAALFIDYGHAESATGETLQAVRDHLFADPLTAPGEADLTAHVDFEALRRGLEAMGAVAFGPIEQALFLKRLGIDARAETLRASQSHAKAHEIDAAMARLTGFGRTGMGALFKALAVAHPSLGTPPGFDG